MTKEEFKTYKSPAAVTAFQLANEYGSLRWGYGFADMLEREGTIDGIGRITRIIAVEEDVFPNLIGGAEHPLVDCWALCELSDSRIVEVKGKVVRSVIDPSLAEVVETGKPKRGK